MTTINLKLYAQGAYTGSGTMAATQPATIKVHDANGVVETLTGTVATDGTLTVNAASVGDYHLSVRTWNTLGVFTAEAVTLDGTTVDYDFTTAAEQAFGGNQVEVESGVFALYSGDVDQNDAITQNDLTLVSNASDNSQTGVVICDLNSDESVDLSDVMIVTNNLGRVVVYPTTFSIGLPNPHHTH